MNGTSQSWRQQEKERDNLSEMNHKETKGKKNLQETIAKSICTNMGKVYTAKEEARIMRLGLTPTETKK